MEATSSQKILEEILQSLEAGRFNIPLLNEVNPKVGQVIQNLTEQNSVFTFEQRELQEFFTDKANGELNHELLSDVYKAMNEAHEQEIQQREEAVKQQPQTIPFACKITENRNLLPLVYTRSLRKMNDEEITGILGIKGVVLEANNLNHMYYVMAEEEIDFWVPQQAVESLVKIDPAAAPVKVKSSTPVTNLRQLNTKYMKSHSRARTKSKDEHLSKTHKRPAVTSMKKKMHSVRSRSRSPDRLLHAPNKVALRSRSPVRRKKEPVTIAKLGRTAQNSAIRRPAAPKPRRRNARRLPEPEPKPKKKGVVSLPKKMLNIAAIRKNIPDKLKKNNNEKKKPPFPIVPLKQLNIPLDEPKAKTKRTKPPGIAFQSTLPTLHYPAVPKDNIAPEATLPTTKPVARDVPQVVNNNRTDVNVTNNNKPGVSVKRTVDEPTLVQPSVEQQQQQQPEVVPKTSVSKAEPTAVVKKEPTTTTMVDETTKEETRERESAVPKKLQALERMREMKKRRNKKKTKTNLKILKQKNNELKEGLQNTKFIPELKKRELLRIEQEEIEKEKLAAVPQNLLQKRQKKKAVSVKSMKDKRIQYQNSRSPNRTQRLDKRISRKTKMMVKESIQSLLTTYLITKDVSLIMETCREAAIDSTVLLEITGHIVTLVDFNDVINCGKFAKDGVLHWVPWACLIKTD